MTAMPIGMAVIFTAAILLGIASNLVLYAMIGEVNRRLPEDQRIGYIFFYPSKWFKITREYRRLYPDGHLNSLRIALGVIGFILVAAGAFLWH